MKEVALDEAQRAEVGEEPAREAAAECAEEAVGDDVLEVHPGPVCAQSGAAAEDHGRAACARGEEGGEVARVVRAVGGEKDVAVHGRVLALHEVHRRTAAVAVAARARFRHEHAGLRAGDFGGAVGGAIDADGDEMWLAGESCAQFVEHRAEARFLVARGDDDGETRSGVGGHGKELGLHSQ